MQRFFDAWIKRDIVMASLCLLLLLDLFFLPVIWSNKTLMMSVRDAGSLFLDGTGGKNVPKATWGRSLDAGGPAWYLEPLLKVEHEQLVKEHRFPLWNPYSAYGAPLAAAMQPQPYYPLTALLALYPTAKTYDLFILARLFIAGLFTFLFVRLFLDFSPALFSAVTFMFSGYLILFLNMPGLSVEVLLPAVFYSFELLLRRQRYRYVAGTAVVICLVLVGGMPESALLVLMFGYSYFLFRFLTDPGLKSKRGNHVKNIIFATAIGFLLSAILLVPFLEYLSVSYDSHQLPNVLGKKTGLTADTGIFTMLAYVLPLVFGPVFNSFFGGWSGLRNYVGILPMLFGVMAVLSYFKPKNKPFKLLHSVVVFFSLSTLLILLKRYGFFLVNWVGVLPLARMVYFPKYEEPLLGLSFAILGGIGFSAWINHELKDKTQRLVPAWLLIFFVVVALVCLPWLRHSRLFYINLCAAIFFTYTVIKLFEYFRMNPRAAWLRLPVFLGLLAFELYVSFIWPCFYLVASCHPGDQIPIGVLRILIFFESIPVTTQEYSGAKVYCFLTGLAFSAYMTSAIWMRSITRGTEGLSGISC